MEAQDRIRPKFFNLHLSKVQEKIKRLLEAACEGDIQLFKELAKKLDSGKGLAATVADSKDADKRGALIFAAAEGKIELCKYLVEELKIDVKEGDIRGKAPVLHAATEGHTATVQYLIEKGADPETPSASLAALHIAAGHGHVELVKLLLSKGVGVDLQSDFGTPLVLAASRGHGDAVKVLLEHHADLYALTGDGNFFPLMSAVAAQSVPCVEQFVKAGAYVNVNVGEITPLIIAAYKGNTEIINCLLQAGADPNVTRKDGTKPIQIAAIEGNRAAVEALLPVTQRIESVPEWSVDGVIEFMQSECRRKQERAEAGRKANKSREPIIPKKDLTEVNPEAKKKAEDERERGNKAFQSNDFATAKDAYMQAINSDPTDGTLYSNRSLCWLRLGQGEHALRDAKACRELRPDWAKAYYREGAVLHLLQRFDEAANAFYRGIQIAPGNKKLISALRLSVEAGRN